MNHTSIQSYIEQILDDHPIQWESGMSQIPILPQLDVGTNMENGRYKIQKVISYIHTKAVYKTSDVFRKGIPVVLKITEITPNCSNPYLRTWLNELDRRGKAGVSKHILGIYDLHVTRYHGADLLFFSIEYADGGNYLNWLQANQDNQDLRLTEGMQYFKHFCTGILQGLQSGLHHTNIKPSNCLLSSGVGKVTDFCSIHEIGYANNDKQVSEQDDSDHAYWSPEEFRTPYQKHYDERSMVYRLGVMLFQLLHPDCQVPFSGSYHELREKHVSFPIPQVPKCPEELQYCINRCLQKNPDSRYASVEKLLHELVQYTGGGGKEEVKTPNPDTDLLWNEMLNLVDNKRVYQAIQCCNSFLQLCPNHIEATSLLETLMYRYQQAGKILESIENGLGQRGLRELVERLQIAYDLCSDHPLATSIQKLLLARSEQFKRSMQKAQESKFNGDHSISRSHFNYAKRINPDIQ